MAIPTSRYSETATVRIDYGKCKACGLCVKVCKGAPLYLENEKVRIDQTRYFGCIGCGHCVAVCPTGAIAVEGRDISQNSFMDIPTKENRAGYEELMALMLARRSIREFEDREVEQEKIDPPPPMGIPPSDVEVLVINGKEKVRKFSDDMLELMKSQKWIFSKPALLLMRPFIKREEYEALDKFLYPAIEIFEEMRKEDTDYLLYGAPLAMYFHVSPYADPADPFITATYAMIAAETMDLGSCMIGTIGVMLKSGGKKMKEKYGINPRNQPGLVVIFGYPAVKYRHAIRRNLAKIRHY
jgi:MinD superfamily P-loop ATPase containing an inserted ferredoxin domain